MLQNPSVIPVDGMVLHPGMFGYGTLVHEAFDAHVLMLLQTFFELLCNLANAHLSAGVWHFVDDVCLLVSREGVFDLKC